MSRRAPAPQGAMPAIPSSVTISTRPRSCFSVRMIEFQKGLSSLTVRMVVTLMSVILMLQ